MKTYSYKSYIIEITNFSYNIHNSYYKLLSCVSTEEEAEEFINSLEGGEEDEIC